MKAERRQELRTNELSMQLDVLVERFRRNLPAIIGGVLAIVVIGGGAWWYIYSNRSRTMDAWATLSIPAEQSDPLLQIRRFEDLAAEQINPALTAAAWLKVAEAALSNYMMPTPPAGGAGPGRADPAMLETARSAYERALAMPTLDRFGVARAMIGLGVIEENLGNFAKARDHYDKVRGDQRFAGSPFEEQAAFRLNGLEDWSRPVTFPQAPPPPPTTQPVTTEPAGASGAGEAGGINPATADPTSSIQFTPAESLTSSPPATPPTTQPAGD